MKHEGFTKEYEDGGWFPEFCWEEDNNEKMTLAMSVYNWTLITFAILILVIGNIPHNFFLGRFTAKLKIRDDYIDSKFTT